MAEPDENCLEQRAEAELSLAQTATHPAAVRAHYLLAGFYLDRLYGQDNDKSPAPEETSWAGRGRY